MDKSAYLDSHPLTRDLPPETRGTLADQLRLRLLEGGETLLREGERTVSFLLMVHGRLAVWREGRLVGHVMPGGAVGEIGLLGDKDNAATLIADRDCLFLEIDRQSMETLMEAHPSLFRRLAQTAIDRLTGKSTGPADGVNEAIALVSLLDDTSRALRLARNLVARFPDAGLVDVGWAEQTVRANVENALGLDQTIKIQEALRQVEARTPTLVWLTDGRDTDWSRRALRQVERIVLLVDPRNDPDLRPIENWLRDTGRQREIELVLIGQGENGRNFDWLGQRSVSELIHVPDESDASLERIANKLREAPARLRNLVNLPLFAEAESFQLDNILSYFKRRTVSAGSILCVEGEPSDSLYLIEAGRFSVSQQGASIGAFGPGEVIGEMGLIGELPRSATLRADRDSVVLELTRDNFDQLTLQLPGLTRRLAQTIAQRVTGGGDRHKKSNVQVLALLSLSTDMGRRQQVLDQYERLRSALDPHGGCALVSADHVDRVLGAKVRKLTPDDPGAGVLAQWLDWKEREQAHLLLVADPEPSEWTRRCLRQADRVVLTAFHDELPDPGPLEHALQSDLETRPPADLIIFQPSDANQGNNTAAWLGPRRLRLHHHMRMENDRDAGRVSRMLTDRAYGVVFSGVSSRVIGHVGVLRALAEFDVPIDCVVGVSSGSTVAALVARGWDWQQSSQEIKRLTKSAVPRLNHFTLPYVSLLEGRHAREILCRTFGDICLEDQFVTCMTMAADISGGELVALRDGPVWRAIRASGSLPLIWPPVTLDGKVLIDGGVMDNTPVRQLEEYCRDGWRLVSNPNPAFTPFDRLVDYGDSLSGWTVLMNKLKGGAKEIYPSLIEIISHTMCIQSYKQQADVDRMVGDGRMVFFNAGVPSDGYFSVKDETIMDQIESLTYKGAYEVLGQRTDFLAALQAKGTNGS